ncbi:hypothetical protein C0992_010134 [Termitomyces sp. T32_za158]|nr:hypothetical protein C0992_010134 [Termitomyces sp. T32_za158]
MAPTHKRKRVQLTPEEEEDVEHIEQPILLVRHDPDKEQEVWESFKDEHVEAIEQVPLALHRHYALIHELDQQVDARSASLLPLLLQYIRKRREMELSLTQYGTSVTTSGVGPKEEPLKSSGSSICHSTEVHDIPQPTPSSLPSKLFKPAITTREMLSQIGCLSDELLRAAEEKVNVAQAACDSVCAVYPLFGLYHHDVLGDKVDRHARLLYQAIKDQEALITLGARPGHLEPGNLSKLTVGRWVKPARATLSPIDGDDLDESLDGIQESTGDDPSEAFKSLQISGTKKGRGRAKEQQQFGEIDVASTPPLTITLPAQVPPEQEEVYCYCKRGSFGEDLSIRYVWFLHLNSTVNSTTSHVLA